MILELSKLLSTWFYAGLSPKAPGTVGSLCTLPIAYLISHFYGISALVAFTTFTFMIGLWSSSYYAKHLSQDKDPKEVVIDEVAGQALVLCVVPPSILYYAIGFLLFRLFDIFKPHDIGVVDRELDGGLGIMLDDIMAALYATPILWILYQVIEAL